MVKDDLEEESPTNKQSEDLLVELGDNVAKLHYRSKPRRIRVSVVRKG